MFLNYLHNLCKYCMFIFYYLYLSCFLVYLLMPFRNSFRNRFFIECQINLKTLVLNTMLKKTELHVLGTTCVLVYPYLSYKITVGGQY